MQPQAIKIILTWILLGIFFACFAQETSSRKVVNRVVPEYPRVAWDNHLGGIVRVEATVAANGTVKNVGNGSRRPANPIRRRRGRGSQVEVDSRRP